MRRTDWTVQPGRPSLILSTILCAKMTCLPKRGRVQERKGSMMEELRFGTVMVTGDVKLFMRVRVMSTDIIGRRLVVMARW